MERHYIPNAGTYFDHSLLLSGTTFTTFDSDHDVLWAKMHSKANEMKIIEDDTMCTI